MSPLASAAGARTCNLRLTLESLAIVSKVAMLSTASWVGMTVSARGQHRHFRQGCVE